MNSNNSNNMTIYFFSTKPVLPDGMTIHDLKRLLESEKLDIFIAPTSLTVQLILGSHADIHEPWCKYVAEREDVIILKVDANPYARKDEKLLDCLARNQDRAFLLWAWENQRDTYKGAVMYDEFVVLYKADQEE